MSGVSLDLHAAAATIALLAAPEFAVEERLIDFQSGGQAGKEGDQSLAVRFSGSEITQHKRSIVPDGWGPDGAGTSGTRSSPVAQSGHSIRTDFDVTPDVNLSKPWQWAVPLDPPGHVRRCLYRGPEQYLPLPG